MKYVFIFLLSVTVCTHFSVGNATFSWENKNKQQMQQTNGDETKKSSSSQKKPGFFARWKEKRKNAQQQKQQQQLRGRPGFQKMVSDMCSTMCTAPKACHLSIKEIDYCNQKCQKIDVKDCMSSPSWEVAKKQLLNTLDEVYSMDDEDHYNQNSPKFDDKGNMLRPPRKDLGETEWRAAKSPTSGYSHYEGKHPLLPQPPSNSDY